MMNERKFLTYRKHLTRKCSNFFYRLIYGGGFLSRRQADSASRLMTPLYLLNF